MKYVCKHIILGRKPRAKKEDDFKTAFFKIFKACNDPLAGNQFPDDELEFANVEKVVYSGPTDFYLEGNDLIFRDLKSVDISQKGTVLHMTFER